MYPVDNKFRMPPEWFPHARTFMGWPVMSSMCWPENYVEICRSYGEVARAIAEFEPVTMIINPGDGEQASRLCGPGVELLEIAHNDSWLRDNGPTFVTNNRNEAAGINWIFNAWGGKYSPWDKDDMVAPAILGKFGMKRFDAPLVLEGGSIHVDGEGTLMTTEECLLNENRNPGLSREEIEAALKNYLGVERVIWLRRGLEGDETDGHVDNVACFARPGQVIMQVCDDPEDPNYEITRENMDILRSTRDAAGRTLEVIPIPQPAPDYYCGGRLTLSYLNFYFVNGGLILPVFGGRFTDTDLIAEETLQRVFPERRIARVDGMMLVKEGGNVHCITQQMPAGSPAAAKEEA